jgi:hypothetical protein
MKLKIERHFENSKYAKDVIERSFDMKCFVLLVDNCMVHLMDTKNLAILPPTDLNDPIET